MSENRKTWLIEAGDVLDVMAPVRKEPATATINRPYSPEPRPATQTPLVETVKRRAKAVPPRKSSLHIALLIALTYVLGPLAILLTPRGRRQTPTMVLAGMSVMATLVLVLSGFGGLVRAQHAASVWVWVTLLVIAVGAGFGAWARAVHLLAREGLPHVNRLPYWLRRKWSISILGLLAPGSGLLLGGHTGRAALTLVLLGPAVAAVLVLANAMNLWRHHVVSGWLATSGPLLENVLMVAVGVAALGFLGYIAQALEGVRQVLVEPSLQTRVKGDYYALAVIAAVIVIVVAVNPVKIAHQFDVGSDILQAEGFQAIPLQLSLAAQHLDPGRPEYALQAIALYNGLGEPEKAAAVRSNLDRSLSTYLAMVQQEAAAEYDLAQAKSVTTARKNASRAQATEVVQPQIARSEAGGIADKPSPTSDPDPLTYMGALVRSEREVVAAVPDTVATVTRASVSRTMGMPFGPGLSASGASSALAERQGPQK